jgi:hypothetical protein
MNDDRLGLPSASGMHRIVACPGSFLAEQAAGPDATDTTDADHGTRIHDALAGRIDPATLSVQEFSTYERCKEQRDELVAKYLSPLDGTETIIRDDRRLWIFAGLQRVCSAKPDEVIIQGQRALVLDYKTLSGDHEPAPGNWQLRTIVAAVYDENSEMCSIVAAIIQPLRGAPSVVEYDFDAIEESHSEIIARSIGAMRDGNARRPFASACRWCRARGTKECPESLAVVPMLAVERPRVGGELVMHPEEIARFLDLAPVAEAVIEAVRAKAKRALETAPDLIPGWKLKPGDVRETITDPATVFANCSRMGVTEADFMAAVKVTKSGLKDVFKAKTGAKGKALDAIVNQVTEGCTESKQASPSLVRVKP